MLSRSSLALTALALALTACGGGSGDGSAPAELGSIRFEITDAPIDPELIQRAVLEVDAIRVHREADGADGFTTVFDAPRPLTVDLLTLRNGVTQPIEAGFLEPGLYRQARLVVSDALLELTSGKSYSTRDGTIHLTSQDTSGYKIFFDPPVEVRAGVETRVLLDFQVPKTFSPVPANDLDSARFFHLHPLVRFAVLQETGELRAVVTTTDDQGAPIPAASAALYVLDPGESDLERAVAVTLTDDAGMAAILGLPAGTFDVVATHQGLQARQDGVVIAAESVTSVSLQVQ
ncbi:MAG TPA: DUF4382 domain-containing protein [Planctomycetota bacterium]